MYCEDVDLNLRARLRGMRTIYVPRAVVYHRLSATGGGDAGELLLRAQFRRWCGPKICPARWRCRYWPALLRAQIGYALNRSGTFASRPRARGCAASSTGLRALPRFLRKRAHRFSATARRSSRLPASRNAICRREPSIPTYEEFDREGPADSPFLSVVVPAYNEERRLPDSLRQITALPRSRSPIAPR